MVNCFVKEGLCGVEVLLKAKKISQAKISLEADTTCKYINSLILNLKEIKIGEELSSKMLKTRIYKLSSKYCCRNSCSVPSAILKTIEVISNISLPKDSLIKFINII